MITCPACRRPLRRAEIDDEDIGCYNVTYVHREEKREDADPEACVLSSIVVWFRFERLLEEGLDALEKAMR
jgi:hypothetical protein